MKKRQDHSWYAKLLSYVVWPLNVMVKECPWCGKLTGFKKGNRGCTGGMCKRCYRKEMEKVGHEEESRT